MLCSAVAGDHTTFLILEPPDAVLVLHAGTLVS